MRKMTVNKQKETFSIEPEWAEEARKVAKDQNRSFSSLVRNVLKNYLQGLQARERAYQKRKKNRKVLRDGEQ